MQGAQTPEQERPKEVELSLPGLVKFFRRNLKLALLLAAVFSAIAMIPALLLPQQYQKRISLDVEQVPSTATEQLEAAGSGQTSVIPSSEETGALAVEAVGSGDFGRVEANAAQDRRAQQVNVTLRSSDRGSLVGITPRVVDAVKVGIGRDYEEELSPVLESRLVALEAEIDQGRAVAAEFDDQAEQLPAYTGSPEDGAVQARREALEEQRAVALTTALQAETESASLQEARSNLPRVAAELVSVEVARETAVEKYRTTLLRAALSVLLGSMLAALVVVVRGVVRALSR